MFYVPVHQAFTAVFRIPESQATDAVTYLIIKASDGLTLESGNAAFIAQNMWKVTFTPNAIDEVYIVRLDDATLDVQVSESYRSVTTPQVATEAGEAQTSEELLHKVESAISARLNGGAVQSYSIGGRNIMYMTLSELMQARDKLKREVGSAKDTRTFAQFGSPS